MEIIDALKWRYATKQFDPSRKVSEEDLQTLMEAANLAPSSYGLQPFRILVINDPKTMAALRKAGYDQSQLTEASHIFVFAAKTDMDPEYVDDYMRRIADVRDHPVSEVEGFGSHIKSSVSQKEREAIVAWNKRQTYIALGILLSTAAQLSIDSCPMEGFDAEAFDRILDLPAKGLTATVIAPVGYRSPEDKMQRLEKVRLPLEEMVVRV